MNVAAGATFYGRDIVIGHDTYVGEDVRIEPNVSIGSDCAIGTGTAFITVTHTLGPHIRRAGEHEYLPITVGNGCWFGANVTVLPGVTIGDGCVIGAASVVTRDCEPDGLYVGSPARRVRELGA